MVERRILLPQCTPALHSAEALAGQQMLETDASLSDIALQCGFTDQGTSALALSPSDRSNTCGVETGSADARQLLRVATLKAAVSDVLPAADRKPADRPRRRRGWDRESLRRSDGLRECPGALDWTRLGMWNARSLAAMTRLARAGVRSTPVRAPSWDRNLRRVCGDKGLCASDFGRYAKTWLHGHADTNSIRLTRSDTATWDFH